MDFNIDTLRFPLSYPDDINTGLMHHCHGVSKNNGAVSELPVTDFVGLVFNLQEDIRYNIDNSSPGTLPRRQYNLAYIPNGTIKLASENGKYSIFCIQFTAYYLKKIKDHFPILADFLKKAEAQPSAVLGDPRPITPDLWHEIHLILIDKDRAEEHHKLLLGPRYVTISMHSLTHLDSFVHLDKTEIEKIREAYAYLQKNSQFHCNVHALAERVNLPTKKLEQGFKKIYGQTVYKALTNARMNRAVMYLRDSDLTVNEIAILVGYKSKDIFYQAFRRSFGYAPVELRKKGDD